MYDIFLKTRPLGAGDLFNYGQRLYRSNFLVFFAIVLVVESAFFVIHKGLGLALTGQMEPRTAVEQMEIAGSYFIYGFLYVLMAWVFATVSAGALTWAVSQRMTEQEVTVVAALKAVVKKLGRLLWTSFLTYLLIALGLLLFIFPAFYFFMSYLLSTQVVMLEDSWGWQAMRRSKQLMGAKTRGDTFLQSSVNRAAIIFLIMLAIGVAAMSVTSLPVMLAGLYESTKGNASFNPAMLFNPTGSMKALALVTQIAQVLVNSLIIPLGTVAFILLYFDIRVVKEGIDIQAMLEEHVTTTADERGSTRTY